MKTTRQHEMIDVSTPLSVRSSFRFPLQSAASRHDLLWGAVLLVLLPGVGWFLNMGHRVVVVHRMQHGEAPWPAWHDYRTLFRHGLITGAGMLYYYSPGLLLAVLAWWQHSLPLAFVAAALMLAATVAIPGYMSHYCRDFDPAEIYNPVRALRRCIEGGVGYWHAWLITVAALGTSFVGLLALGAGFLVTSVWFWQVAGFSFASVFTQHFALKALPSSGPNQALQPTRAQPSQPRAGILRAGG